MNKKRWIIPVAVIVLLAVFFGIYVSVYYHADAKAREALESDEAVAVTAADFGWLFDGSSEDTALIFYPGAKVETEAYAPFLHLLAGEGADVFLVDMPFRLAFFKMNAAKDVMAQYQYENWYIGGHSLGGAMAASYAGKNPESLKGLVLCAAYPTKKLNDSLAEVSIYGSEDQVLNKEKVEKGRNYAPKDYTEYVIEGGNHAQFGSYGEQKGDGAARITPEEQREEAVKVIVEGMKP